jgi:N-acyl-D-amino-acid deacylase
MTLLIKNVTIIGGDRTFKEGTDVFVNDNKISAIGDFPNKKADIVIDGQGAYLSPGFIDSNTDSDHYLTLFDNPSQEDFLRQGVTTIMGGMCGSSLAPLLYGSLESIQKWGDTNRINVNWHSMAEFIASLEKRPLGVNFGTLVGHSTLRRAIVGEALRDLTKNEMSVFSHMLETALSEGAYGFSTGLEYVHAKKTPYSELRVFAEITKKFQGVYATHLRDGSAGVKESVEETIKIARESGVSVLISHFVPVVGFEKEYEAALEMINTLSQDVDLNFDIYPSPYSMTPIYTFLPSWAQNGGTKIMLTNISDDWLLARIKKDLPDIDEDNFIVAQAPGNDFLVGKSLKEIKQMYELTDKREALIKLMQIMQLRGSVLYKNLNMELIKKAIASKRSLIASNAPSFAEQEQGRRHLKSERTTATFINFLSLVEDHKILSLEDAIRKITLDPAKKFGLGGRGQIKEGNFADLVCFKGTEIKFTVVNGRVVEKENEFENIFSGTVLHQQRQKINPRLKA